MSTQKRTLMLVLAFGALIGSALLFYWMLSGLAPPMIEPVETGEQYIDFAAEDAAGNPVRLSDFTGTPTVVYFWASWCPACVQGMNELQYFYEQEGEGVQVLAVNLATFGNRPNEVEAGRTFMEEMGFLFSSIYDIHNEAARVYGINAIPFTLFIASDGTLVHSHLGTMSASTIVHYTALLD